MGRQKPRHEEHDKAHERFGETHLDIPVQIAKKHIKITWLETEGKVKTASGPLSCHTTPPALCHHTINHMADTDIRSITANGTDERPMPTSEGGNNTACQVEGIAD